MKKYIGEGRTLLKQGNIEKLYNVSYIQSSKEAADESED